MGNCATCCGKQDTHEVDTTEKIKGAKLGKSEAGVAFGADIGRKGFGKITFTLTLKAKKLTMKDKPILS